MPADRDERRPDEDAKGADGPASQRFIGGQLIGAGFEFIAVCGLLTALGWWIDSKTGTAPIVLIVFMAIGLIGSTYKLWKVGSSVNRKQ